MLECCSVLVIMNAIPRRAGATGVTFPVKVLIGREEAVEKSESVISDGVLSDYVQVERQMHLGAALDCCLLCLPEAGRLLARRSGPLFGDMIAVREMILQKRE